MFKKFEKKYLTFLLLLIGYNFVTPMTPEKATSQKQPETGILASIRPDFSKVPPSKKEWKKLANKSTVFPGDLEKYFAFLLEHEKDIQSHNWDFKDEPLLTVATRRCDVNLVKRLRMRGVQYEATQDGYTALHAACDIGMYQDTPELVEFLIHEGLPVNAQTKRCSHTALFLAVRGRLAKSVSILTQYHADPNLRSTSGIPLLSEACCPFDGDFSILQALIDAKANINASDEFGRTALHVAHIGAIYAKTKDDEARIRQELISFLQSNGANPEQLNCWGKKPSNQQEIIRVGNKSGILIPFKNI